METNLTHTIQRPTVLITGASRGIGRAIALKFANEGWNLVITCLERQELLMQTMLECEEKGVACLPVVCDAGDPDACQKLFDRARNRFGRIDALVNNAGISWMGLLQDMTTEQWDRILRTNLSSVFHCCRLAIPDMVSRHKGHIINISSVWGVDGASCEAAYSATKGGVNALTKALARELAPSGIQVNAIACGAIDTEMNSSALSPEELLALAEEIPAGRLGRADEVADLTYSIATGSAYLTGQIIGLTGGWQM